MHQPACELRVLHLGSHAGRILLGKAAIGSSMQARHARAAGLLTAHSLSRPCAYSRPACTSADRTAPARADC